MAEAERCNDEFWGTRCEKPPGHPEPHSAMKGAARITWGTRPSPEHANDESPPGPLYIE
jgi:hypothetical protein